MKFLMIVLAIHTALELISNKQKDKKTNRLKQPVETVYHPAEFLLR
jgi:hypothetical protein